ncbi:hypothetical protein GOP47_0016353 [Adiantum capillus-veneris]|uniref:Nonsense-mediated mRNA decay factor SMG8 n=1 Tax=Adiantum capillus-veneris TaxID=13818 RepID=A0A9D4UHG9_ADICA|nr:hypothetical protein GOP47_0016353 [Adiantum capillus-veneris]
MENVGGNLRMLSRASSASSGVGTQTQSSSSSSSSIPLSSSSIPYTPPTSSSFTAPPTAHNIPPYPPPACPPLPSASLLSSASGRAFPSNNPGGKITILTSSASSTPSLLPSSSAANVVPVAAELPFSASGPGLFAVETPPLDNLSSGVVVVGAIGRLEADVSQLLNRLLDAQVFGSKAHGNQDCTSLFENVRDEFERVTSLDPSQQPSMVPQKKGDVPAAGQGQASGDEGRKEVKTQDAAAASATGLKGSIRRSWMRKRLKLYHDEEKGAVYVQFAWGSFPMESMTTDMSMEDSEECMLRGLLYMFSVCHVLLLVQEGSRVDTHLLRTLRILQNAKHLLAPFVKSHVLPGLQLTPFALERTSSSTRPSFHSAGQGSGRSGTGGRNASTIGLMSGSAPSFYPGQCTPVLLFVFLEDFNDANANSHASSNADDKTDPSGMLTQQSGGPIIPSRQAVHLKGSNAVVMLARATNRTEGGLRKKLQSSLEAQIRYLVKKCKVLGGYGDGGAIGIGPRGPGNSMGSASGPLGGSSLFVLDTMRAVCLLDKGPNLQGDALKAAMSIINDILKGKEEAVSGLSDVAGNPAEDIQALRDFVWKQADILRGRGGILTNSTGGSMGVGMVAAAAAAAAASAAAGGFGGSGGALKPLGNPPELPSMSSWLSACRILLDAVVTREGQIVKEFKKVQPVRVAGSSRRGSFESGNVTIQGKEALGLTLGSLSCAADFDMRFSDEWCKRMFPSVLATYTKALPPCYPTHVHQCHLEKALHSFKGLVRGPAVNLFTEKLKADCEAIWKSGRQLCDAVSLTGRPCIHKVHDVSQGSTDEVKILDAKEKELSDRQEASSGHAKPHSSGVVFLHACACGRSRRLREDPFDFEMANTSFFQFANCEDLLPVLVIPDCEGNKPMGGSAWGLVRLGGSKYYQHSTGLLQTGFSHNKKFLAPWVITYVWGLPKQETSGFFAQALQSNRHIPLPSVSRSLIGALSFLDVLEQGSSRAQNDQDDAATHGQGVTNEKKSKVLELTGLGERKGTSLANANAASDERRLFADVARNAVDFPPLQQRQLHPKTVKQAGAVDKKDAPQMSAPFDLDQGFTAGDKVPLYKDLSLKDKGQPILGTGASTIAALDRVQELSTVGIKNALIHLGFEYECPRGHRFFLSMEQLEALGSIGFMEDSLIASQHQSREADEISKPTRRQQGMLASGVSTGVTQEQGSKHSAETPWNSNVSDTTSCKIVNEGSGEGYLLLNKNLPIYMTCPYCSKLSDKKKKNIPKYAGNVSQLQRIYLVTPSLPLLIAACPSVQFEEACVMQVDLKGRLGSTKFSIGCSVVLPPESFVVLRLPFVYYLELVDGSKHPLNCKTVQPEKTAWLMKGTAFKIISGSENGSV